ncbi:AlbA family DNA-binding domain-containing protein [Spirilliplanes yamanashiensis]|uniref:Schlafen AlbA-2 domain-containing protein n=1 Tax=Spirilliplanes yamanashiensis TaxID=42233 RepID=A0A8J4DMQ8_9ACTN|nr:ATP-binding protein [Spirilliplanes yamanashiensis]MDP9818455.1 hypothetical protein [Spirilliplanes yamanashiensis]GIJ06420.1 hypothetical protein Sya03_57720 [Spirilliplanes yamanashiensis]
MNSSATAYLGPDHGRWRPDTWQDLLDAAAGGLLDESHWVDLKRELPTGKPKHNTDLAKDLASLAVDGGLLVIGIEDDESRAGEVCGVELAKLADRVDQVARDKVRPRLDVRSTEIADPDRPGWGCLLVHVPASSRAPHMVDYVYYGRGDRANTKLGDDDVRRIHREREAGHRHVEQALEDLVAHCPVPASQHESGHLYVLVQPATAADDVLVPLLTDPNFTHLVVGMNQEIAREFGLTRIDPALYEANRRRQHAEGVALTSGLGLAQLIERYVLELVVRESGTVSLICGRGTDIEHGYRFFPRPEPQKVVHPGVILSLTHAVLALSGRIADQYAGYQGEWNIGVRLTGLADAVAWDHTQGMHLELKDAVYGRERYQRVTTAVTDDLIAQPQQVVERLLGPLLRGLGVGHRHLPYR